METCLRSTMGVLTGHLGVEPVASFPFYGGGRRGGFIFRPSPVSCDLDAPPFRSARGPSAGGASTDGGREDLRRHPHSVVDRPRRGEHRRPGHRRVERPGGAPRWRYLPGPRPLGARGRPHAPPPEPPAPPLPVGGGPDPSALRLVGPRGDRGLGDG